MLYHLLKQHNSNALHLHPYEISIVIIMVVTVTVTHVKKRYDARQAVWQ